jgi:hypothetical protein
MSDRYDKIRDDAKFRRDQAEKSGVGFRIADPIEGRKTATAKQNPANLWYAVLYRLRTESYVKR